MTKYKIDVLIERLVNLESGKEVVAPAGFFWSCAAVLESLRAENELLRERTQAAIDAIKDGDEHSAYQYLSAAFNISGVCKTTRVKP